MRKVRSYLGNSTDLVRILQTLKIPAHSHLATLDITSLYTDITHSEAITIFLKIFKHHPKKVFLVDLLKYVLKNNVFKFDNVTFAQICGIAMGTKLAPALATIYVASIEEQILENREKTPIF